MKYYYPSANQLKHIADDAGYSSNYTEDIDNQSNATNYTYDAIGNLKTDAGEGLTNIDWNVYGKIKSITKSTGSISYTYDASGNRISKTVGDKTTIYVRDATGNVMSMYERIASAALNQVETHLYGSSRLGIQKELTVLPLDVALSSGFTDGKLSTFTRGEKFFEVSNHLGNVLVTVSDKKIQVGSGTAIEYYAADIASANDYYPFGMLQPGRSYNAGGYRYGFNGKENDNEVKGEGSQQDYGMRIYDPRVGKFLSIDPISKNYPQLTPYQFASNSPISGVDLDGLEYLNFNTAMYRMVYQTSKTEITNANGTKVSITNSSTVVKSVYSNIPEALRDPAMQDFKYVAGGPVTTAGRDWDTQKDEPVVYPEGRYYHSTSAFFGGLSGEDGLSHSSSTGLYNFKTTPDALDVNEAASSRIASPADAIQQIAGIAGNFSNMSEWRALGDETLARRAFYGATNTVNSINLRNGFGGNSLNDRDKGMLINFFTDGYLPIEAYHKYGAEMANSAKLNTLEGFLNVASHGIQALGKAGMLKKETVSQVNSLLREYKSLGGDASRYDAMSPYLKEKK